MTANINSVLEQSRISEIQKKRKPSPAYLRKTYPGCLCQSLEEALAQELMSCGPGPKSAPRPVSYGPQAKNHFYIFQNGIKNQKKNSIS